MVTNYTFFTVVIKSILSYLNQFYHNTVFIKSIYQKTNFYQTQKDCHEGNLSFSCIQFYEENCLNILVDSIWCH